MDPRGAQQTTCHYRKGCARLMIHHPGITILVGTVILGIFGLPIYASFKTLMRKIRIERCSDQLKAIYRAAKERSPSIPIDEYIKKAPDDSLTCPDNPQHGRYASPRELGLQNTLGKRRIILVDRAAFHDGYRNVLLDDGEVLLIQEGQLEYVR